MAAMETSYHMTGVRFQFRRQKSMIVQNKIAINWLTNFGDYVMAL